MSDTEVDLHKTFDAHEWAKEFCRINPEADFDTMVSWFANALMMGWDEHRFRSKEYKKQIRRVLVPAWKRWFVPLERFGR